MNNDHNVSNKVDQVKLFLAVAFAVSWLTALVIYLTGGLVKSPELIPGTGITLALVLLASVYMWGPAIAHIITRLITREGWGSAFLKPVIKTGWPWWLVGWFGPSLLVLIGALIYFLLFPASYDAQLTVLTSQLEAAGISGGSISPWQIVLLQTGLAMLISPLVNLVATFGEEFGWRAYLLPMLAKMGTRRALIISSLIWGVWHWPVILMGHNYGLGYWGYPWSGLLAMTWFCLSAGVVIGWVTLKAGSVWPAVFAHGALNGLAAIGLLFLKGQPDMLLGPTPAGIIGALPFSVISLVILLTIRDQPDLQPVE
jgi:membrane protease YdiL (CAAX protease family)